jgi:hypothetical protein
MGGLFSRRPTSEESANRFLEVLRSGWATDTIYAEIDHLIAVGKINPDARSPDGTKSLLDLAVHYRAPDLVLLLIKHGASCNPDDVDAYLRSWRADGGDSRVGRRNSATLEERWEGIKKSLRRSSIL